MCTVPTEQNDPGACCRLIVIYLFCFMYIVYKSQFPKTLAQGRTGEPYVKKVIGGVSFLVAISLGFFAFLRTYSKYERLFDLLE